MATRWWWIWLAACSPVPATERPAPLEMAAPPVRVAPTAVCPGTGPTARIVVGTKSAQTARGLEVTLRGMSFDHYDDGTFAMLVDLELRTDSESTTWLPDATDRQWHSLLGRCLHLVEATDGGVTLEITAAR